MPKSWFARPPSYVKSGVWGEVLGKDGTKINFKSYEQGREKFQGAGKRVIWFDEEPPKDIWEECTVRSEAGVPLDIIMTMTPVNGMTWVYDEIYLDTSNPDIFVSEADWDDNPWLEEEQKAKMGRRLTPQALEVRKKGKFVKKTGLVCPWWQRGVHVKPITYDSNWAIYGALDFGFSNPACLVFVGVNYDDDLAIFDGFYKRGLTTPAIALNIVRICNAYNINMNELVIIADSAQAQSIQELNDISAEKKYGFTVLGVKKETGTNTQNWDEFRADKMQQYGEIQENNKTKITVSDKLMEYDEKVDKDVNWFVKEIENLKWAEVASAVGKEKQQGATWDDRFPNHAIDAFSYFVVFNLGTPDTPSEPKIGAGKIPGTYITPADETLDANFVSEQSSDLYNDDIVDML